jgi:pilus assembly protein Flp/PilA
MSIVKNFFKSLLNKQDGQTLAEYALILVLIAIVCIGVLTLLGTSVSGVLTTIAGAL